jgi:tRNA(Ile)-lysidine synthase
MKKNNTKILRKKIALLNQKQNFYHNNEKTLVGFSGGADSVTLLHALCALLGKDRLVALHINHMLRGEEADGDEEFCRDFCQKREIPFLSRKIDIKAICGDNGFEEAARNVRYKAFEEVAEAMNCTTVSLAHTASDNLETILFHLCRGAGASGLSGIPVQRPLGKYTVVRPLLDVTREEILAYAEENELPFRTDSTNANTAYTRNFIRAEIIPLMRKINPAAEENARYAASAVSDLQAYAEEEAALFLQANDQNGCVSADELKKLSPAVRYPVLETLCKRAGGEMLSRSQAIALDGIISERKTGASVSLSGNLIARLDGENLRFFNKAVENEKEMPKTALFHGKNQISENTFLYVGEIPDGNFSYFTSVAIDEKSLASLFARPRENGEAYRFGGMTRKLKKLLCGRSLAEKNRPVICDGDGVIWLPGFPAADGKSGEITIYYVEK